MKTIAELKANPNFQSLPDEEKKLAIDQYNWVSITNKEEFRALNSEEQKEAFTQYVAQKDMSFMERLGEGVTIATPEESKEYFEEDDFRWGETLQGDDSPTGSPIIYINDRKYEGTGVSPAYRDKAVKGEMLHLLKNKFPERYKKLRESANNPKMNRWARESYEYAKKDGEKRPFDEWFDHSRFDQVVGGYLQAQDPDIPTMKNWKRDRLPVGEPFRQELESLSEDFFKESGAK